MEEWGVRVQRWRIVMSPLSEALIVLFVSSTSMSLLIVSNLIFLIDCAVVGNLAAVRRWSLFEVSMCVVCVSSKSIPK